MPHSIAIQPPVVITVDDGGDALHIPRVATTAAVVVVLVLISLTNLLGSTDITWNRGSICHRTLHCLGKDFFS